MNLNCKYREIGDVGSPVRSLILGYLNSHDLWGVDVSRQRSYGVHRNTESVMFRLGSLCSENFRNDHVTKLAWVQNEFAIVNLLSSLGVDECKVVNMIAVRLPAGYSIDGHCDSGALLSGSHRVHVPLVTHEDVEFCIDNVKINMKVGKAYEINNMLWHSVKNNSDIDRIHLIFDYVD